MKEEDTIFDYYVQDFRIESFSYKMMGMLLETEKVKERIEAYHISELYIYGGGYLGVQLYNAVKNLTDVKAIVDRKGILSVDVRGIPVISLEQLKREYTNQRIIITPIKYYTSIKKDLREFVEEDKLLFLGEFLEGVL